MDNARFDRLTTALGTRLSRRSALAAGAGLAAAGLTRAVPLTLAQEATPEAAVTEHPAFLFVQLADSGSWAPKPGEDGVYLLTLRGTGEQTLYFSDRPDRIVGTLPTDRFLETLGFTPFNPPNAAVVVTTPEGERDVLVLELRNPVYTRSFGDDSDELLTYEATVLSGYQGTGLAEWTPQVDDDALPQEFENVSLFIDDCPDATGCYVRKRPPGSDSEFAYRLVYVGEIPGGGYGRCYNWGLASCWPCSDTNEVIFEANARCNAAYPGPEGCFGLCTTDTCRWGGTC